MSNSILSIFFKRKLTRNEMKNQLDSLFNRAIGEMGRNQLQEERGREDMEHLVHIAEFQNSLTILKDKLLRLLDQNVQDYCTYKAIAESALYLSKYFHHLSERRYQALLEFGATEKYNDLCNANFFPITGYILVISIALLMVVCTFIIPMLSPVVPYFSAMIIIPSIWTTVTLFAALITSLCEFIHQYKLNCAINRYRQELPDPLPTELPNDDDDTLSNNHNENNLLSEESTMTDFTESSSIL